MAKIIVAKDQNHAKQLSSMYRQKKLRRVYRGVYTDDLTQPLSSIVLNNWMDIVSHVVSKGILSFRTAMELKPVFYEGQGVVFMTSTYSNNLTLPGLAIKVIKGNDYDYIEQILPGIARSNTARMLLENLSTVRGSKLKKIKTIGKKGVEDFLAKELHLRNVDRLNEIRDDAKVIANDLNYHVEYRKLSQIISALLSTHIERDYLTSKYAVAIANEKPYDGKRIKMLEDFVVYLKKCNFAKRTYQYKKTTFKNLSFFESYFSNFIEGTEFIIDEAEEIVFKGSEINNRHADSHDVLANFTLSNDFTEMTMTPRSAEELIEILQNRHAYLMKERPEKRPGQFKEKPNRAGNTYFVEPAEVIGTLSQGFELYHMLSDGFEKAIFMHLLISEVHPFDDGNGKLSRIMMNAEFVKSGKYKIIIPTVHRDNYLMGLRLVSRDNNFRVYCKVMDQAQAYTASVNWLDYGEAREKIEANHANEISDEGLPFFNRVLRELQLSEFE